MKKYMLNMKVTENVRLHTHYCLLKLTTEDPLPPMMPGQFVEVRVDNSPTTLLRRPISINYVDREKNELWLLIQLVGDGTRKMAEWQPGDVANILLPLGNGYTLPTVEEKGEKLLLVGGGVGTAPLLYLGHCLKEKGFTPTFLLGGRSRLDIQQLELFEKIGGEVCVTTEDGSLGEQGYVTNHSILQNQQFERIYTCGPKPMMMAVAKYAHTHNIMCEVSLENRMACGIGACLCCVEKLSNGHNTCVCTEGPVFNINQLSWLI